MKKFLSCLVLAVFAPVFNLIAEDSVNSTDSKSDQKPIEVVISATKIETPTDQVASSITVISEDEIESKQQMSVLDSLKGVPSVDVVQSGGPGGNTSIFLRGGNSEHTLVLVDGIEINSPISPARACNFADLTNDNVERIEVLKGPQSVLYGSDAMAGVINIITKKGDGDTKGFASVNGGFFGTVIERAGINGSTKNVEYSVGASRQDMNGISAAGSKYGNTEKDGYGNTSVSSRVGVNTDGKDFGAQLLLRYVNASADLDNFGGEYGDDPNRVAKDEGVFSRVQLNGALFDETWKQTLGFSYSDQSFRDDNDPDAMHPQDLLRSKYRGYLNKVDWLNQIAVNDMLEFVGGFDSAQENGNSQYHSESSFGPYDSDFDSPSTTTNGYYLEANVKAYERLFSSFGMRMDDHSKFGTKVTWRIAPALVFNESDTKIKGTVGTAFKSPSLFQLYSMYGNQDLRPEKNIGWDTGVEQGIFNKAATLGITYFSNHFDDLISFNPNTFVSENIAKANSRGMEVYIDSNLSDSVMTRLGYTYTDTQDEELKTSLLRRPRNKVSADLQYKITDAARVNVGLLLVGDRFDNNYSTYPVERVRLGGYALVNIAASYAVAEHVELFAKGENIFNKEYEDIYGYGTLGAGVYGGVKVKL